MEREPNSFVILSPKTELILLYKYSYQKLLIWISFSIYVPFSLLRITFFRQNYIQASFRKQVSTPHANFWKCLICPTANSHDFNLSSPGNLIEWRTGHSNVNLFLYCRIDTTLERLCFHWIISPVLDALQLTSSRRNSCSRQTYMADLVRIFIVIIVFISRMNFDFWGLSKCKLQWVACKVYMKPSSLWSRSSLVYISINIRKIKFNAYILMPFNQNLDKKSYVGPKIEEVKHLHAVFLLTTEQRRRPIRWYIAMVYFDVTDVAWLDVVIGI